MEDVSKSVDEGNAVDVLYLDFAKAFDKVPRKRLVKKVEAQGIQGQAARWIESWLKERTQRVVLGEERSNAVHVSSGLPKGSVLGPSLFMIFNNDLDLTFLQR